MYAINTIIQSRFALNGFRELGPGSAATWAATDLLTGSRTLVYLCAGPPRMREGFLDAARRSAHVGHPNLARALKIGEEDGEAYVAYDSGGTSLEAMVQAEGPLAPGRAVAIVGQVLEALSHLHGRGLVHGTLEPSAVVVTRGGHVEVQRFGFATFAHSRAYATEQCEWHSDFEAPERPWARRSDPRMDVYAAAGLLFWALTGAVPGADALATVRRLAGERAWLAPVLRRGLAPEPAARHEDAAALRRHLERAAGADAARCPPAYEVPSLQQRSA